MCCESEGHHHGGKHRGHHPGHRGGSCCCGAHSDFGPCFWTKEEKIARLEQYLADRQEEVKAVQERIAALKGE
ncbi:MAG: hypothetical protein SXV54_02535 [Chloroflexota bacterium]|nr:hypothetical protein [Chloroflexota bacterium]